MKEVALLCYQLFTDRCADMPVKKDEKLSKCISDHVYVVLCTFWLSGELMGVMRVGALARGLMLQGERQMEVVLMMKSMCTCCVVCVCMWVWPRICMCTCTYVEFHLNKCNCK